MAQLTGVKAFFYNSRRIFNNILNSLTPIGDLIIRYWLSKLFFLSALMQLEYWKSTVLQFTYNYELPFLSDKADADFMTGVGLVLPIFLLLGLGGRLPAFLLFIFNIISIFADPFLFTSDGYVSLLLHVYWGMLLMMLMFHGPGKLSLDYFIAWYKGKTEGFEENIVKDY